MSSELAELVALAGVRAAARAVEQWHAWPGLGAEGRSALRDVYIREGVMGVPGPGYEWCGAFAAYCWPEIHPLIRRSLWPSTYRLALFGDYRADRNIIPLHWARVGDRVAEARIVHASAGSSRCRWTGEGARTAALQPGDVVCVDGKGPWGRHVALVVEPSAPEAEVITISGNGSGLWPRHKRGSGVVKYAYSRPRIWQALRPSAIDMDPAVVPVYRR